MVEVVEREHFLAVAFGGRFEARCWRCSGSSPCCARSVLIRHSTAARTSAQVARVRGSAACSGRASRAPWRSSPPGRPRRPSRSTGRPARRAGARCAGSSPGADACAQRVRARRVRCDVLAARLRGRCAQRLRCARGAGRGSARVRRVRASASGDGVCARWRRRRRAASGRPDEQRGGGCHERFAEAGHPLAVGGAPGSI